MDSRQTFGHWEGDSVVGGLGNGSASLFTGTERSIGLQIIKKTESRKKPEIVRVVNHLERQAGSKWFRDFFQSFTFDNGIEFTDGQAIEKSVITKGNRTSIYYAHPYSSFERGTNENHNGIIRRWIPKGMDITTITDSEIRRIQDWMNTYPRKRLNGLSPIEKLKEIKGDDYQIPAFIAIREKNYE